MKSSDPPTSSAGSSEQSVVGAGSACWVRLDEGSVQLLGLPELVISAGPVALPLLPEAGVDPAWHARNGAPCRGGAWPVLPPTRNRLSCNT
jgi:hypothetical protein